jgi:membrane protease YdiL (CAAX protease family)
MTSALHLRIHEIRHGRLVSEARPVHASYLGVAATTVQIAWTFAAFGEELGYRSYIMAHAEHALGEGCAALLISSILFGIRHYYKVRPG